MPALIWSLFAYPIITTSAAGPVMSPTPVPKRSEELAVGGGGRGAGRVWGWMTGPSFVGGGMLPGSLVVGGAASAVMEGARTARPATASTKAVTILVVRDLLMDGST